MRCDRCLGPSERSPFLLPYCVAVLHSKNFCNPPECQWSFEATANVALQIATFHKWAVTLASVILYPDASKVISRYRATPSGLPPLKPKSMDCLRIGTIPIHHTSDFVCFHAPGLYWPDCSTVDCEKGLKVIRP